MQTWIHTLDANRPVDPRTDWQRCADATDPERGGKQALESMQMVRAILANTSAYPGHHAVTLSWAKYVSALAWHGLVFADTFGRTTCSAYLAQHADPDAPLPTWFAMPDVLGAVVTNQRARLVAKEIEAETTRALWYDPCWYRSLYPGVQPVSGNVYPTMLMCPRQPGSRVAFERRGIREIGRVVDVKPAGLEVRIQHDRGACWRRTSDVTAA